MKQRQRKRQMMTARKVPSKAQRILMANWQRALETTFWQIVDEIDADHKRHPEGLMAWVQSGQLGLPEGAP